MHNHPIVIGLTVLAGIVGLFAAAFETTLILYDRKQARRVGEHFAHVHLDSWENL